MMTSGQCACSGATLPATDVCNGIDDDCMAMSCLFAAFAELVATYGEFASNARGPGRLAHSYASNMNDAGVYIGGCMPCDALINDVLSEWNGLGYSGTNSGGDLYVVSSVWRNNRSGLVPASLDLEQGGAEVVQPGDRVAVRAGRGHAEHLGQPLLDDGGERVRDRFDSDRRVHLVGVERANHVIAVMISVGPVGVVFVSTARMRTSINAMS